MTQSFPLFWIAFLPLLSGLILMASGPRMRRSTAHLLAIGALMGSAALALWALADGLIPLIQKFNALPPHLKPTGRAHPRLVSDLGAWIQSGGFQVRIAFAMDSLALCMTGLTLVATLCIQFFARVLLHEKGLWWKNLGAVNLTAGAVLIFVLADNMILGLAGWVLAGVAGSLAVGLDGPSAQASRSARTAWLTARLSDVALLLAVLVILAYCRHLDYEGFLRTAPILSSPQNRWILGLKPVYFVTLLLGAAALCRAGQFPLHVWLAESSAGSGLATALLGGVVAPTGVYLLLRLNVVVQRAPAALLVVAAVATVSALALSLVACAQTHFRRAITYLVACQTGLALVAVGTGSFAGGFLHIMVVSLAGTGLAMAATAVERSLKGRQDLREMGSMLRTMPWTGAAFLLSAVTLAGFFPLSGHHSSLELLSRALTHIFPRTPFIMRAQPQVAVAHSWAIFLVATLAAGICAFALLRLFFRVFTASPDQPSELKGKRLPPILAASVLGISIVAAGVGLLWAGTVSRWFDFEPFLGSSFKGRLHWVVREGWRATGVGDLVHIKSSVRWTIALLHQAALLLGALIAGFFFFGRVRRAAAGRMISWKPYRWFYRGLHQQLGAGATLRFFTDRILTGLGWVERSITERLLADGIFTRIPVRVVQAAGWLTARAQMWNRKAFIAAAVAAVAILAALAARPVKTVSVRTEGSNTVLNVGPGPAGRGLGPLVVKWDLDGDGKWDKSGHTVRHSFPEAKEHKITVEIFDPRFKTRVRFTKKFRTKRLKEDPSTTRSPRPRRPDGSGRPGVRP